MWEGNWGKKLTLWPFSDWCSKFAVLNWLPFFWSTFDNFNLKNSREIWKALMHLKIVFGMKIYL